MTNEELTVFDELITEVKLLRSEVVSLKRKFSDAYEAQANAEKERDNEVEDNNRLREENANLHNQVTELTAERDDARQKLGEWARLINFGIYERMNKFVPKGKSEKKRLMCYVDLADEIISRLEQFQREHPITFIEGGEAK